MYTGEQLGRYLYFQKLLAGSDVDIILDPLTGVVARGYMLDFARSLIENGTPFTFAMVDLDNFKFINDTYGHQTGDAVLADIGEKLAAYVGDCGVVGRFGGDEFLIIDMKNISYDDKKSFMVGMYTQDTVLRRNIPLGICSPFITGTTGCATYPIDAADYDTLFQMIDKTLYRGKTKGRNCYIIYVKEKHENIEIRKLARHGVYTAMQNLIRQFEMVPTIPNKLLSVLPFLKDELRISDLYIVDTSKRMIAVLDREFSEQVPDIDNLFTDDLFTTNRMEDVAARSPAFYEVLNRHEIETMAALRVGIEMERYGYLICAEAHNRRIWQEDECAILFFLSKMIAATIQTTHENLSV